MVEHFVFHSKFHPHFTELYSDDVNEPEMSRSINSSTVTTKILRLSANFSLRKKIAFIWSPVDFVEFSNIALHKHLHCIVLQLKIEYKHVDYQLNKI